MLEINSLLQRMIAESFFASGDTESDIPPEVPQDAEISLQRLRKRRYPVIEDLQVFFITSVVVNYFKLVYLLIGIAEQYHIGNDAQQFCLILSRIDMDRCLLACLKSLRIVKEQFHAVFRHQCSQTIICF